MYVIVSNMREYSFSAFLSWEFFWYL